MEEVERKRRFELSSFVVKLLPDPGFRGTLGSIESCCGCCRVSQTIPEGLPCESARARQAKSEERKTHLHHHRCFFLLPSIERRKKKHQSLTWLSVLIKWMPRPG